MAECDEHTAYAGRNYLPFLLGPYGTLRPLLFNCLEIMGLRAASQDPIMERMIGAVLAPRSQRREEVGAAGLGPEVTTDLNRLSAAWRKHLPPTPFVAASTCQIPRNYFAPQVLAQATATQQEG